VQRPHDADQQVLRQAGPITGVAGDRPRVGSKSGSVGF
jgi:hypothetical protein